MGIIFQGQMFYWNSWFLMAELKRSWQCWHSCIAESLWKTLLCLLSLTGSMELKPAWANEDMCLIHIFSMHFKGFCYLNTLRTKSNILKTFCKSFDYFDEVVANLFNNTFPYWIAATTKITVKLSNIRELVFCFQFIFWVSARLKHLEYPVDVIFLKF